LTTEQRKFKGVWIPAEMWLDRSLSITEKVMLVEIDSLHDEERGCYASNAHFAQFFNLSISRVSEIISSLSDRQLISVELVRDGKRIVERRIRLIGNPFGKPNTPSENAANPFGKDGEPPSENTQGSNTSLSNTKEKKKEQRAHAIKPTFDEESRSFVGIDDDTIKLWSEAYPALDIRAEIKRAAAWLFANPKNRKSDYLRFLTNWLNRAQDRAPRVGAPPLIPRSPSGRPSMNDFDAPPASDYADVFQTKRGWKQ
jgi:hypothetical protein